MRENLCKWSQNFFFYKCNIFDHCVLLLCSNKQSQFLLFESAVIVFHQVYQICHYYEYKMMHKKRHTGCCSSFPHASPAFHAVFENHLVASISLVSHSQSSGVEQNTFTTNYLPQVIYFSDIKLLTHSPLGPLSSKGVVLWMMEVWAGGAFMSQTGEVREL